MGVKPLIIPAPGETPASPLFMAAHRVVSRIHSAGHEAYFAGGFARDILIGRDIHDIDIASSAKPSEIQALFERHRAIGKSFGVIQVDIDDYSFDVATFRIDKNYQDGRHPTEVSFTTAEQDAERRDFTINGMFYDPDEHHIIDYVHGYEDIKSGIIRAIGDPALRFAEDRLRIMRAVRFAATLEFKIEDATWVAIQREASQLRSISMERIRGEFIRTLMESPRPGDALFMLRDAGILAVILPEAQALSGVEQPPEHHPEGDVFTHTAMMLNGMENRSPELVWSILLHDIGKPGTFAVSTDKLGKPRIQFKGHAELGADMAAVIMKRFRCSNDEIDAVTTAVRNHMKFIAVPDMRNSTLRKWVGSKHFPLELELHRIDCSSSHGKLDNHAFVTDFQKKMSEEPVLPPPLVNGRDLLDAGYKSGPGMGILLKQIYDAQLEGIVHTREEAMAWLKAHPHDSPDVDK